MLPQQLGGVTLGVVYDGPTRSIRPILGVAGGARFGEPLMSRLEWGSMSPDGSVGLFSRQRQMSVGRVGQDGSVVLSALDSIPGIPDRMAWSRSSQAAAMWFRKTGAVYTVTQLQGEPVVSGPMDISAMPANVTALAISTGGEQLFVGVTDPSAGGVYLVQADQPPVCLYQLASPAAMAFSPAGSHLFVSDSDTGQILDLRVSGNALTASVLALDAFAPTGPSAIGVSQDGTRVILVSQSAPTARLYDAATGNLIAEIMTDVVKSSSAHGRPPTLDPIGRNDIFWMGGRIGSHDPAWLLSTRQNLGAFFIPAVALVGGIR